MKKLVLHGLAVSPNVRSARIALMEKGIDYHFHEIDFDYLATEEYAKLNPFGKMPTLQHGEFVLYETPAILSYVDEAFDDVSLQPTASKTRAQMHKWNGIAANYLYSMGVMQLFLHRIMFPIMGNDPNEAIITSSAETIALYLDVLDRELTAAFLLGDAFSLADILTGAMVSYIDMTKEGQDLIQARPKIEVWLNRLNYRESFQQSLADLLRDKKQH